MRVLSWRHRALLAELRPVATRLEQEIGPRQKEAGFHFNILSMTETGLTLNETPEDTALLADCTHLAEALRKRGIQRIELDVQLEEGQIAEALLLFLHAHPHLKEASAPREEYNGWGGRGIAGQLLTDQGFHRFCFLLHADQDAGVFRVTYSYCELPLSIFVQRYVQNHAEYGDHRVLFKAAPRIAALVFAVLLAPTLLFVWVPAAAIALYCILGVLSALAAGVTLYTLGSIQYTREHHDTMMRRYVQQIEKLSRFPEANPSVVLELSSCGEALYVNPAGKTLFAELDLSEDGLEYLLSTGYRDLVRDSLEAPGRIFRDETTCSDRSFSLRYVSFPGGESVVLVAIEITYLKQIEADLREAHALSEAQKEQIAEAYRLLDAEFEIIGAIQRALLPREIPKVPGLEIATHYETCQRAGGDYYDFFPLRSGRLGILIADVSGHGSPAAVLMAITHTIAHILHEEALEIAPHEVVARLNYSLARHYQHQGDFVTAIYGVYDPADRTFLFSSAGHNPPAIHEAKDNGTRFLPKQCGIPLGILEAARFESTEISLCAGDTLLLYTDGITEAMNENKHLFGDARMAKCIGIGAPACDQVTQLLDEVRAFTKEEPLNDDRTVVLLRGVAVLD